MNKETWDEIQQTILLLASFGMWVMFEHWCYKNSLYAALPHTGSVRLVLTNLVTGLFTYIYTKSHPSAENGGNGVKANAKND